MRFGLAMAGMLLYVEIRKKKEIRVFPVKKSKIASSLLPTIASTTDLYYVSFMRLLISS